MGDHKFVVHGCGNIPDTEPENDLNTIYYSMDGVKQPEITLRDALAVYHAVKDIGSIEWTIIVGLMMQNARRNTDISHIISKIETLSKVSAGVCEIK